MHFRFRVEKLREATVTVSPYAMLDGRPFLTNRIVVPRTFFEAAGWPAVEDAVFECELSPPVVIEDGE